MTTYRFLAETFQARRERHDIFKVLRKNLPTKVITKNLRREKEFYRQATVKERSTNKPAA